MWDRDCLGGTHHKVTKTYHIFIRLEQWFSSVSPVSARGRKSNVLRAKNVNIDSEKKNYFKGKIIIDI